MDTAIERAVAILGSQSALARVLNVRPQSVQQWVRSGQPPAERCRRIEASTGGQVTRYDLRPDVFGAAPADRDIA